MTYRERWQEQDGVMKPVIDRIHTIPIEDNDLLHCAQVSCWCSPAPDSADPQIINHQAATPASAGWVLIGECDDTTTETP